MQNNRQNYIKNHWKRYPTLSSAWKSYGKIKAILDNKMLLQTTQGNIWFEPVKFDTEPIQYFMVGDIVGQHSEYGWDFITPLRESEYIQPIEMRSTQIIQFGMQTSELEVQKIRLWSLFSHAVRTFFLNQNFLEIETPSLVVSPGTEPALDTFQTTFELGSKQETLSLPTSPEINLKKYLSQYANPIFEIKKCFRNAEITERHQPEFTMLEWYRPYSSLLQIKIDIADLIRYLLQDSNLLAQFQKICRIDKNQNAVLMSMDRLIFKSLSIQEQFANCGLDIDVNSHYDDYKRLYENYLQTKNSTSPLIGDFKLDDYFFLLMNELIEPSLVPNECIFLEKYPPFQSALARKDLDGWGERFEFYWQGLEIANAFDELNDPELQIQQSLNDLSLKIQNNKKRVDLDSEFYKAIYRGIPPTSGVALGLERLFMALFNFENIREGKAFSYDYK